MVTSPITLHYTVWTVTSIHVVLNPSDLSPALTKNLCDSGCFLFFFGGGGSVLICFTIFEKVLEVMEVIFK